MASGAEHYREAERLLAGRTAPADDELKLPATWFPPTTDQLLEAIGHGLLALGAAAALRPAEDNAATAADWTAWFNAVSVQPAVE